MKDPGRRSFHLILELIARMPSPVHYLEIGVCEGTTSDPVISLPQVELAVLVDNWTLGFGGTGRGNANHIVSLLGDRMKKTVILSGDSTNVLPAVEHRFDLIFVDGDHTEEGCRRDMTNCLHLLAANGLMVVDDVDHPAHTYLRAVVEEFAKANGLSIEWHPDEWFGMAVLRKP